MSIMALTVCLNVHITVLFKINELKHVFVSDYQSLENPKQCLFRKRAASLCSNVLENAGKNIFLFRVLG